MTEAPPPRGEETRAALVAAALDLYGDKGYEATSTREIAAAAERQRAMIAYHFGGKEGLRAACADFVAERLRGVFAGGRPTRTPPRPPAPRWPPCCARSSAASSPSEAARPLARFLMREMADPSAAFARVYDAAFAPLHARACASGRARPAANRKARRPACACSP